MRTKKEKDILRETVQQATDFQDIISSIGDGVSIQDTDFKILYQNQAHKNMIGEHIGQHCFIAYENNENVCEGCPVQKTFLDGNVHIKERRVEVDGKILYVEITSSPLKNASGKIIAGIEAVRNITKRKKAEILLNETLDKLDLKVKERTAELEHEIVERKQMEIALRESQERWKTIVQSEPECVKLLDKDGCLLEMNPAGLSMIQATIDQVRGERMSRLVVPEDRAGFDAMLSSVINGETKSLVFDVVGLRGKRLTLETTSTPLWESDKKDKIKALLGVTRDITERKRAEEKLRISEKILNKSQEIAHLGSWHLDIKENLLTWSDEQYRIFGQTPQEFGETYEAFLDTIHPDDRDMVDKTYTNAIENNLPYECIHRVIKPDGEVSVVLEKSEDVVDESGRTIHSFGYTQDITELKLAEEARQESEKKYRDVVEGTDDLITTVNDRGKITFANNMSEKYLGVSSEELIGASAFPFIHPDDQEMTERWFKDCLNRRLSFAVIENRQVNQKTGEVFWMSWTSSFYYDGQGKLESVNGISRDITERKKIEAALLESEERFRALMHQSPSVIELYDTDGLQIEVNSAYELLWGFPASHTVNKFNLLKSKEVVDTGLIDYVNRAYEGEAVKVPVYRFDSTGETEGKGKGRVRWLSTRIYPLKNRAGDVQHVVITHEDVSEIKFAEQEKEKLESQLRQTYKMEAVGTMAGGIAHDFNNILSIILGNADIALDDIPVGNSARHNIDQILNASRRAKELVKQILTFSRQSAQELLPIKPCSVFKESLKLLRSTTPRTVDIVQDLCDDQDDVTILADATQLHQLLMNLFSNSIYAMSEKGTLTVNCDVVILDASDIVHSGNLKPGRHVKLSVGDTGIGITRETRERMFDPFYTTKEVDKGTGMGLAIVLGIVLGHGGLITVDSVPGEGTTFNMFFPIVKTGEIQRTEVPGQLSQGNERILFVDDEKMMAEMGSTMLERQGYKVTSKTSSIDALKTFKSEPDAFDLVITDQTMPNMSGAELAGGLLKIRPGVPIILCTGYSKKISEKDAKELGIREFLLKPFDRRQLAESVRKVLDENTSHANS